MKSRETYRQKVQASFLGVAIGDALGMPVEIMTQGQIAKLNKGKGILTFQDAAQTRTDNLSHFRAGATTDDWQLTEAIAQSMIQKSAYDFDDIVMSQIREYHKTTAGWGRSTWQSLLAVEKFYATKGKSGRDPRKIKREIVARAGCGNGVAMKITPIAMFHALRKERVADNKMLSTCIEQGLVTHDDIRASISAYALCWLMSSLVKGEIQAGSEKSAYRFKSLIKATRAAEKLYTAYHPYKDSVSSRLELIYQNDLLNNHSELIKNIGTSCYALESVPFAIALFFRNPTDFRAAVLEAVNSGGDTDTNAAMVGALVGSNDGLRSIPEDWRCFNKTFRDAQILGSKFFDTFA